MSKTDDALGAKSRKPKQRGQFFIVDVPALAAIPQNVRSSNGWDGQEGPLRLC